MIQRGSLGTIACLFLLLGLCADLRAQDDLLKQAQDLYERGRDAEALTKLKEVLARDPSSEDAFRLQNLLETRDWVRIMVRGGEHHAVVQELFRLAIPAQGAKARDAEKIRELVAQVYAGDWPSRNQAMLKLAADHGEYAVSHLLGALASEDTERRAVTMEVLRRLGTQSVTPLIQALESEDRMIQANALTVLGQIGDIRALPYLAASASAPDEMIRNAATRALADMGKSGMGERQITELFLATAEGYYSNSTDYVDPFRRTYVVWAWGDEGLVAREVPRDVYNLKLAEEILYDILAWDPKQQQAQVLLCSTFLAEAAAAAGSGEGDSPTSALTNAEDMAASMGAATVNGAVRKALRDSRPEVAARGVSLLGRLLDKKTAGSSALNDGLSSPFKEVRFASALAQAHLGMGAGAPLVSVLSEGLGQDAVRTAIVIDDQPDTRNRVVGDLNGRGYFAYGVDHGARGLSHLREYPIEDLVIIRYDMRDSTVNQVIKTIRQDERTAELPIAILVSPSDLDAAKSNYEDRVQAFIQSPPVADAYEPGLRELVKVTDETREKSTMVAAACAQALAHMDDPRSAKDALLGTLLGDDRVRIPAMHALGKIGDASTNGPILALLQDGTVSEEVRGAAALALARIAQRSGSTSSDVMAAIQGAVSGEGGAAYWKALGAACGILPADAAARFKLLQGLRQRITIDADE